MNINALKWNGRFWYIKKTFRVDKGVGIDTAQIAIQISIEVYL